MAVYIIRAPSVRKVKIGVSDDVDRRLEELRAASPVPLELVEVFAAGGRDVEMTIHRLCAPYHSHNEWFDEDGALEQAQRWFTIMRTSASKVAQAICGVVHGDDLSRLVEQMKLADDVDLILDAIANLVGKSVMDKRYGEQS